MRNFVISLVCLIMVIAVWIGFFIYSDKKVESYNEMLDVIIKEYVDTGSWNEATEAFDDLQHDWSKFRHTASFFLDSSAINHIDSTFRKIRYYINADDQSNSSGELAYLKGLFLTLHNNEALTPENVF